MPSDSKNQVGEGRVVRGALLAGIGAALWVLFHLQGNSASVDAYSRSAFRWMVALWHYRDYDFSHGWIIPLVSLFVVWQRRRELREGATGEWRPALIAIAGCLLLHALGLRTQQTRLSLFAFIGLLWSIPAYLAGPRVARLLIFPCAYLIFCIPFTFFDVLSFRLRLVGAGVSCALLNGVGIETVRNGTALLSSAGSGFALDVADPCSGLKYFMSLNALTAAYACLTQKTLLKKWLLFLSATPLAVGGNVVRITGIAVIARLFGQDFAAGIYHNWSGYIVFIVAVLLMLWFQAALNFPYRQKLAAWRQAAR
jgi:exosortase